MYNGFLEKNRQVHAKCNELYGVIDRVGANIKQHEDELSKDRWRDEYDAAERHLNRM